MKLGLVLLAAGASQRMGRPKLLLPWGSTTVLEHQLQQWREVGATQLTMVVAPDSPYVAAGVERIINPEPTRGMWSSIQTAAQWGGWSGDLTHWVVALGDQPHVLAKTLKRLWQRAQHEGNRIVQPWGDGKARHPVLLPRVDFLAVATATENNLKEFLQNRADSIGFEEIAEPGLSRDMDTPQDYEELQRLYAP